MKKENAQEGDQDQDGNIRFRKMLHRGKERGTWEEVAEEKVWRGFEISHHLQKMFVFCMETLHLYFPR